jgi:hypothetical protein
MQDAAYTPAKQLLMTANLADPPAREGVVTAMDAYARSLAYPVGPISTNGVISREVQVE